jgi:FAD/FMN-containing dehydrogenase
VPPRARICTSEEAVSVWRVRESALGAMVFVPGEPDRWEGWEDAGSAGEAGHVSAQAITALMAEYGYSSPLYGHYGQGCVHTRINFDFRTVEGRASFASSLTRAADVVLSLRRIALRRAWRRTIARGAAAQDVWAGVDGGLPRVQGDLWDPDNRMNPGKLVDAVRVYDPVENLRTRAQTRDREMRPRCLPAKLETHFAFAADEGSFGSATERCVGVGACRNTKAA